MSPSNDTRSLISNLSFLGTNGEGFLTFKLYISGRFARMISKTSLKPRVVINAVTEPFLSVMALITVVPP